MLHFSDDILIHRQTRHVEDAIVQVVRVELNPVDFNLQLKNLFFEHFIISLQGLDLVLRMATLALFDRELGLEFSHSFRNFLVALAQVVQRVVDLLPILKLVLQLLIHLLQIHHLLPGQLDLLP